MIYYCLGAEIRLVLKLLDEVHSRFFSAHAARLPGNTRRKAGSSQKMYDVTVSQVSDHRMVLCML